MYFDALNKNMNSKNYKCNILWPFWPKNCSFGYDRWIRGEMTSFGAKMTTICYIFYFFELIFVFSASKYIGYDVKIVIFCKFIFDILSIRSSSIEFSFALCISQTLIKFKNILYTYSMLSNPLAVGCPGGAAKIRGK